jgi:hypothetical protein
MTEGWLGDIDRYMKQIDQDPLFQLELDYCETAGLRHSRFSEWAPDDQAKSLANLLWKRQKKADTCEMCGTPPAAWLDPKTKRALHPPPFLIEWENCEGCNAKDREEKTRETRGIKDAGMRTVFRPNPEASD